MFAHHRKLVTVGLVLLLTAAISNGQEEMVANPYYKFWAETKPGATAVQLEQTKLSGPEGKLVPGGVDEKRIIYKLVEVDKDRAVVEMVVTEQDFLGYIQAAPTRYIYPAKLKQAYLERFMTEKEIKAGEETVTIAGKEMKTKTKSGVLKGSDGEKIEFKLWVSADVPGMVVKQVRTSRQKDKDDVIAETTTTLESYKAGE